MTAIAAEPAPPAAPRPPALRLPQPRRDRGQAAGPRDRPAAVGRRLPDGAAVRHRRVLARPGQVARRLQPRRRLRADPHRVQLRDLRPSGPARGPRRLPGARHPAPPERHAGRRGPPARRAAHGQPVGDPDRDRRHPHRRRRRVRRAAARPGRRLLPRARPDRRRHAQPRPVRRVARPHRPGRRRGRHDDLPAAHVLRRAVDAAGHDARRRCAAPATTRRSARPSPPCRTAWPASGRPPAGWPSWRATRWPSGCSPGACSAGNDSEADRGSHSPPLGRLKIFIPNGGG